jgi:hypothetical protein
MRIPLTGLMRKCPASAGHFPVDAMWSWRASHAVCGAFDPPLNDASRDAVGSFHGFQHFSRDSLSLIDSTRPKPPIPWHVSASAYSNMIESKPRKLALVR